MSDVPCCRIITRFSKNLLLKVLCNPVFACKCTPHETACVCAVLDGNQVLDFYWTDPIDAMKRFVAKLQYKNKLYTTFQPGTSALHPNARVFEKANSGMIFQSFYLLDMGSSQLVALFYADASFSGASMTHHPIYSEQLFALLLLLSLLILL